ncbi:MAG: amphi-Trp domain-containing protein [Dehalococcoidales bacterium]|nr:amphi-Trp domain-containing protein [Dehalococcoidales bacterium]
MSDKTTFEYAGKMTNKVVAEHLSKLAEVFRYKEFEIQGLGKNIHFSLEKTARFELKALSKENEGEIQLEISWKADTTPAEKLEIIPSITDTNDCKS